MDYVAKKINLVDFDPVPDANVMFSWERTDLIDALKVTV